MLSHIENFQNLSELEFVREVNEQLDRAKEKIHEHLLAYLGQYSIFLS